MSDGGEGFLDVIARPGDTWHDCEVADPLGRPTMARYILRGDVAYIESARTSGLMLLACAQRDPLRTTTFGVGQAMTDCIRNSARHVVVGLGGTATVDGGAGALIALDAPVRRADGSGVKIGGGELGSVAFAGPAPSLALASLTVLADVDTILEDAAAQFGPQKGADAAGVEQLATGLMRWADVAERDLAAGRRIRDEVGTGAAGGLGFGLRCAFGADIARGADAVAALVGFDVAVSDADVVVTGEGRLDGTSWQGKVVGAVCSRTPDRARVAAVVGSVQRAAGRGRLSAVEAAAPDGPGDDPYGDVVAAARRLAAAW
jgi:glycerate 2-kinase